MCTRRQFLVGSVFGLTLADALVHAKSGRAKSVILVWLDGGPSHLDMFDLKPDAPVEVRGEFKPTKTPLDGVRVCEHLPRIAAMLDKTTLIRSITSPEGNHDRASHYMLTGYRPTPALVYAAMGSVVAREVGVGTALPNYIAIPTPPSYAGAGYLTAAFEPFSVNSDPSRDFRVQDLAAPVPDDRLDRRRSMLTAIDRFCTSVEAMPARDTFLGQAFGLVTSKEARAAFDLSKEDDAARQRYGPTKIGQSCLLARRLVEAGVRFVTVNDDGWDTHDNSWKRLAGTFNQGKMIYRGKLPDLDQAYSALLGDLAERGLLESTLVVLMGEFGRTPKLNSIGGRDHWPRANSVLLAGGGVKRGQVVGETDAYGELPASRPVLPEDLLATIYHLLGIDPEREFRTETGRPIRILSGGEVVKEALAWDGEFLYVARPGGVDVYRDGKLVRSLGEDKRKVMALAARGKRLAEGGGRAGERGEVRIWEGGKLLHKIEAHGDLVYRLAWSADGRFLFTAGGDAKVGVIDAETGRVLEYLEGHTGPVLALAVRGEVVVSGGADRTIRVWKDRKLQRTIANHWEPVHALVFSPDGRHLASGSADRTIRVWQPEIGRLVRIIKGHDGTILDLAWTEKHLVSASADGKVRLIAPDDVTILRTVDGRGDWINAVVSSGRRLHAADASGRLLEVDE